MDFLDFIVAVAVIGVLVFVCFNNYSHVIWSDAVIKWKGVQTTAEVVDSTTARTRLASLYHSQRYAHYITYEFTDTASKKWTITKRVRPHHRLAGVVKGAKLSAYYLPDRPDKSTLE